MTNVTALLCPVFTLPSAAPFIPPQVWILKVLPYNKPLAYKSPSQSASQGTQPMIGGTRSGPRERL